MCNSCFLLRKTKFIKFYQVHLTHFLQFQAGISQLCLWKQSYSYTSVGFFFTFCRVHNICSSVLSTESSFLFPEKSIFGMLHYNSCSSQILKVHKKSEEIIHNPIKIISPIKLMLTLIVQIIHLLQLILINNTVTRIDFILTFFSVLRKPHVSVPSPKPVWR